ncbi:MAG: hypothetical protein OH319_00165 [Candidatus Parvarchaeota archaeon]|nr:hypothetical protein [Candidatus Jingweiarchaeum tengchongense]MCW1310850.1 hypothetical protein [Candidatus Jingweiarchaeum tengchongense]
MFVKLYISIGNIPIRKERIQTHKLILFNLNCKLRISLDVRINEIRKNKNVSLVMIPNPEKSEANNKNFKFLVSLYLLNK